MELRKQVAASKGQMADSINSSLGFNWRLRQSGKVFPSDYGAQGHGYWKVGL
jgi:hypothetical protein